MFSFWIAVSFPGLVSDSGHDGARLCPYWRNLPLLYGVSGLKKVCYIGFPVGSIARVAEQVLWGVVKVSCPLGKKKKTGKLEKWAFIHKLMWKPKGLVWVLTSSLTGKWPSFPRRGLHSLYTPGLLVKKAPLILSLPLTLTHIPKWLRAKLKNNLIQDGRGNFNIT